MPVYEYEPTLTSELDPVSECCFFETLQKISEPVMTTCPTCGHVIHRAVSSFSYSVKSSNGGKSPALGKGLFQTSQLSNLEVDKEQKERAEVESSAGSDTRAKRAARMAMRHICASGCRH